ncbi:MAG TPA: LamG domain-containing protein [Kofleriaceae bacterium]|nr:LamG domain-containing protein [Kofleriaceae bacterium]
MRLLAAAIVLTTACGRVDFAASQRDDAASPPSSPDACSGVDVVTGRIGWWKLDEGSGTTVGDTASGNAGTLLGGVTWTTGRLGDPALEFDGVDGRVDVAGGIAYATQNAPFSFSAWFDLTDYSTTTPDIMQIHSDTASPFHVLMSSMSGYLGLSTGSGDGSWATIKTGVMPTTGTWHHVVMTYNGAGAATMSNFSLFLDDVAQPLLVADGYATQAQQSRIGAAEDPRNNWIGAISDVRIYNRELSTIEVGTLYALQCD